MEANGSLGEEEDMMMMMRKGKHPYSSLPCPSSSSRCHHQYRQQPPASEEDEEEQGAGDVVVILEREHMFDKVVTPSDVGKLNRLVIPKQYAERYFPLDSATHDKGLHLCFEDSSGMPWRFRYSYWNSSQSYVMTKGWSRFVKDKKLDAGDIISFHRTRDKHFIDWRRRPDPPPHPSSSLYHHHQHHYRYLSPAPSKYSIFMPPPPPILPRDSRLYWPNHPLSGYLNNKNSVIYMTPATTGPQWQQQGGGSSPVMDPTVYDSVPVVQAGKAEAAHKRLRLFGVNMDVCPITTSGSGSTNISDSHLIQGKSSSTSISYPAAEETGGGPLCCNPHGQYLYPFQSTLYNGTLASSSTSSSMSTGASPHRPPCPWARNSPTNDDAYMISKARYS